MSDLDSLDYLQTGFDPASLTVPRIRSILVTHDIDYPSGAKKGQLIEIFENKLLPQARKLLAARDRARRTSRGIVDVESSQESSTTGNDEELMPPPPTPRPRSTRKASGRVRSDESELDVSSSRTRSPTKQTPRASKHARVSDTETGTDVESSRTVRKSRKSEAAPTPVTAPRQSLAPKIKSEDQEDGAAASRRQSNFSYDNPFQSGSSPPTDISSGERSRKSLGGTKDPKRKSTITRRRTDVPAMERDIHPPTSEIFEIPVSELKWRGTTELMESIEPTEEFTPEAQLELVRERAANGLNPIPPRRTPRTQARGIGKGPIWMVLLTLLGGYATWYRQEKIAVGYCGVGRDAREIIPANLDVPDWLKILAEPQCEPCPQHAYCSGFMELSCEEDFILKPHPLSLGGLVPFPPTCEPDGEKVRRVKAVADRAVEELRERRAKWECGDLVDEQGVPEVAVEIAAEELKIEVSKKRRKGMSEAEFEELWGGAIGEIEGRDEVESRADGPKTLLTSNSLARLPFTCAIRRSLRQSVERHRVQIVSMISILSFVFYLRQLFNSYRAVNAMVPELVSLTLDRLSSQVTLHAKDPETFPENWISIGQLRDDVLRDVHSIKKRDAIWSKVRNVVEMNANVRSSQRESRNGEISRVWEWIGAVGSLEDGDVKRRRKSGRVSWGAYDENSSPVSGMDGGPKWDKEMKELRPISKWEESRPIY